MTPEIELLMNFLDLSHALNEFPWSDLTCSALQPPGTESGFVDVHVFICSRINPLLLIFAQRLTDCFGHLTTHWNILVVVLKVVSLVYQMGPQRWRNSEYI
jgi:hypothetical protein